MPFSRLVGSLPLPEGADADQPDTVSFVAKANIFT
jgi:hypothetical protein